MLQDRPVQHHRWRCPYCRYSFLMTVDDDSIRIGDSLIRKHMRYLHWPAVLFA